MLARLGVAVIALTAFSVLSAQGTWTPPPRPVETPKRIRADVAHPFQLSDRHVRSVLNVTHPMRYGDYVWRDEDVPPGPVWIRVDRRAQLLSVFRGPNEIGTAVILYGASTKPTPAGRFPILEKSRDHRSSTYDAEMPYTLRLTGDGVSIHAASVKEGRATHGCIGVPTDFARKLFDQVRRGDPVIIV